MNKLKAITAILGLIALPISFYIQFWIISQLDADRLIWFLFWVNIPVIILVHILSKIIEKD